MEGRNYVKETRRHYLGIEKQIDHSYLPTLLSESRPDTNDEVLLVKRCRNNEAEAQRILFNRYAEPMMLVCLRYLSNREDAREALMDSFLRFFKSISRYEWRGEGSVRAWLKQITINQCLMRLRKKKLFFDELDETAQGENWIREDEALARLSVKEILKVLEELPEGYRIVFNLYVIEDMGHKDIAELLDISESTSKSQLHRARKALQEKLTTE